jgi:predicted MFS family arabinose efflux permease
MALTLTAVPTRPLTPAAIALAGALSLAVAMGIGRFAFTPILPMMLADGVVDLPQASWLASANYLGYTLGALLCTVQPWVWSRWPALPSLRFVSLIRAGLVSTGVLTLAMALNWPAAWPALRFAAGVTSAVVFVFTSGWCMSQLAQRGMPAMGGLIYVGPGAGIVVSGLLASALVAIGWPAAVAWGVFGVLAFALLASVWQYLVGPEEKLASRPAPAQPSTPNRMGRWELPVLTLAYGLAGFGYIVTATFLPVIARTALPGSAWLDLFWPIFGAGIMVGAVLATRIPARLDRRWLLTACYTLQALGVLCSLVLPSLPGFAAGSLMLGLPFTAITFFAMQEARRLRPEAAASLIGLLTAFYAVGQILGPPMVAVLMRHTPTASAGFTWSLEIAAGALVLGAGLFAWLARTYPLAVGHPPGR